MRWGLGLALHRLSDRLHVLAHRVVPDPDWRRANGVDAAELEQLRARGMRAAAELARGDLPAAEQRALADHLRGFHSRRRSRCPDDCPLR